MEKLFVYGINMQQICMIAVTLDCASAYRFISICKSRFIRKKRRFIRSNIRFLTAVDRASLGSLLGKPSSAYGLSGGFFPGVPRFSSTFDERSAQYK